MFRLFLCLLVATCVGASACSGDDASDSGSCLAGVSDLPVAPVSGEPATDSLVLLAHDSFAVSDGVLEEFTAATGIDVEVLTLGDTGQLVAEAVLTSDNPLGDVLFGIDNTFLCRGLEADLFAPIQIDGLDTVDPALDLDPHHRVVPIDYGDVCLNTAPDAPPVDSFLDLVDPAFDGLFVTQDPETSSPGLAFLLATIAALGDGWRDYWAALADNDIEVAPDWTTAYFEEFSVNGGDRPVVTSYATSVAAVPSTGVVADSCFRQIEFAGVLSGTEHPAEAAALVEFLLSPEFQVDVAPSMFVYPASSAVELPADFAAASPIPDPLTMDPQTIHANRDDWTAEWREIVLG